jgi:hypothetical protein
LLRQQNYLPGVHGNGKRNDNRFAFFGLVDGTENCCPLFDHFFSASTLWFWQKEKPPEAIQVL